MATRRNHLPADKSFAAKRDALAYAKELRDAGWTARLVRLAGGAWLVTPGFSKRRKTNGITRLKANPNRLHDAKIKIGRKLVSGKAKYDSRAKRVRVFVAPAVAARVNPHRALRGKRYRVITEAKPGTLLLGGVRRHVSSWFATREDAKAFQETYTNQINAGVSRIEAGVGRIDIGPGGSWVR